MRAQRACSRPKDMRRRNSSSSDEHSMATPSPRPSTSSAPISVPDVSTISSRLVPAAGASAASGGGRAAERAAHGARDEKAVRAAACGAQSGSAEALPRAALAYGRVP